jgi:MFS family permease
MAAAAAVAAVGVLPVFLTGALAVQLRADLDFDEGDLGLTVAAFFGTAAVLSTVGGRVAARRGPPAATRCAALLSAGTLALVAVAATSFELLLLCLVVGGAGNALAQPATNLLVAQRVEPDRLGMAFGVKQSAIPIATLLGGLAVPTVALTVGWRWAYAGGAVVAAALAWRDPGSVEGIEVRRGARRTADDAPLRVLALLGTGAALGAAAAGTLGSFLVSSAVATGLSEGAAGLLAFGCSAAGITTRMALGARADRRRGDQLPVVVVLLGVGALAYVALASGEAWLAVVGGLAGYCLAWAWPGLVNLTVVRSNPGAPGAATGITQTGTYAGAVLGPLLFGIAVDTTSYRVAWIGSAVTCALAALAFSRAKLGRGDV